MIKLFKKIFGSPFSENELIVCIDERGWNGPQSLNLVYGGFYFAKAILKNPCGHGFSIDVGSRFDDKDSFSVCNKCRTELPGQGIHWAVTTRFRRATKEETLYYIQKNSQSTLETLLREERYEEAEKLKTYLDDHKV